MTRHLIIVTVPFHMPFMQFHELLLVVLTMPWSASFPHTCKSSSLTNLSKRLSRNRPKMLFYHFKDVLIVLTGQCSAIPVPTKMSMQTQLPPMSVSVQTLASPQSLLQTIRRAKAQDRNKLEKQFSTSNSQAVWQGLQQITQHLNRNQHL